MTVRVGIIDYGAGNMRSVQQALIHLEADTQIVTDPDKVVGFSHIVVPGVGSFNRAMKTIKERGIDELLHQLVKKEIPMLGISLGLQILASRSSEDGETNGLNLIEGDVDRFDFKSGVTGLKVPHVGFSTVCPTEMSRLFKGFDTEVDFYFTHSYRLQTPITDSVAAYSWHGEKYVSAVEQGLLAGTQFHPEKSQANGLRLLSNFLELF